MLRIGPRAKYLSGTSDLGGSLIVTRLLFAHASILTGLVEVCRRITGVVRWKISQRLIRDCIRSKFLEIRDGLIWRRESWLFAFVVG